MERWGRQFAQQTELRNHTTQTGNATERSKRNIFSDFCSQTIGNYFLPHPQTLFFPSPLARKQIPFLRRMKGKQSFLPTCIFREIENRIWVFRLRQQKSLSKNNKKVTNFFLKKYTKRPLITVSVALCSLSLSIFSRISRPIVSGAQPRGMGKAGGENRCLVGERRHHVITALPLFRPDGLLCYTDSSREVCYDLRFPNKCHKEKGKLERAYLFVLLFGKAAIIQMEGS